MSRLVPIKDLGVPVPADTSKILALVCYYGQAGFTPDQATPQAARIVVPISSLKSVGVGTPPVQYYDDPVSTQLPAAVPDGTYDFYFAFNEAVDGSGAESDLSPKVTEVIDRTVPPAPGQPIVLG